MTYTSTMYAQIHTIPEAVILVYVYICNLAHVNVIYIIHTRRFDRRRYSTSQIPITYSIAFFAVYWDVMDQSAKNHSLVSPNILIPKWYPMDYHHGSSNQCWSPSATLLLETYNDMQPPRCPWVLLNDILVFKQLLLQRWTIYSFDQPLEIIIHHMFKIFSKSQQFSCFWKVRISP